MKKNFLKEILVYAPGILFPSAIRYLSLKLFTNFFSQNTYGILTLILTVYQLFSVCIYGWLNVTLMRFYTSDENENKESVINNIFILFLTVYVIVTLLLLLVINYIAIFNDINHLSIVLLIIAIGITSLQEMIFILLRIYHKSTLFSLTKVFSSILGISISLTLIYYVALDVEAVLIGYIIPHLIVVLFLFNRLKLNKKFSFKYFNLIEIKTFLKFGAPLILTFLSTWILSLSDRLLLKALTSNTEVAIYSVAYTISNSIISIFSSVLIFVAYPILIKKWETEGEIASLEILKKINKYLLIIICPIITCLVVFSRDIIVLFSSYLYLEGARIIPLVAIGSLFYSIYMHNNKLFILKKNTQSLSKIVFFAAIFNIILNLLLIPIYGALGASIATLFAYIILFLLTNYYANIKLKQVIDISSAIRIGLFTVLVIVILNLTKNFNYIFIIGELFVLSIIYVYFIYKMEAEKEIKEKFINLIKKGGKNEK